MKLVISGAYYKVGDEILVPNFTGEYNIVDCTRYLLKKEILERYDKSWLKEHKNNYVIVDNIKYYYAEYDSYYIDDNWELLSDLSKLEHIETNFNF